jgi:hypothetical protein
MGIAISLVVIAAGAILAFAVTGRSSEIDVPTVGWILMAVGFLGLLFALARWERWFRGDPRAERRLPPR